MAGLGARPAQSLPPPSSTPPWTSPGISSFERCRLDRIFRIMESACASNPSGKHGAASSLAPSALKTRSGLGCHPERSEGSQSLLGLAKAKLIQEDTDGGNDDRGSSQV